MFLHRDPNREYTYLPTYLRSRRYVYRDVVRTCYSYRDELELCALRLSLIPPCSPGRTPFPFFCYRFPPSSLVVISTMQLLSKRYALDSFFLGKESFDSVIRATSSYFAYSRFCSSQRSPSASSRS